MTLNHSSFEWFEADSWKPSPKGLPSSLMKLSHKVLVHYELLGVPVAHEFEDFKLAVFGFFTTLSNLAADSVLGQNFRSRVRDRFRLINAPITGV